MNKHTTPPVWKLSKFNSHVYKADAYPMGNWNRHKKRRIPSSVRTEGRRQRYLRRHN